MPRKDRYRLMAIVAAIVVFILVNFLFTSGDQANSGAAEPVANNSGSPAANDVVPSSSDELPNVDEVVYNNTEYGFSFTLPKSWQGYTIITDKWEGFSMDENTSGTVTETGPLISIRHPLWTAQNPRQDIPIMVFTVGQWESLQKEDFHIGAAPIGPSELGRNSTYVFALPARYNYAFPTGFEEVEKILSGNPLKPFDVK